MDLKNAMASGVFIEFRDALDNSVGHAVYFEWRGRAVPAVGDSIACRVVRPTGGRARKLRGRVRSRHFEVQTQEDGEPCVWVRIVVDAAVGHQAVKPHRWPRPNSRSFSDN